MKRILSLLFACLCLLTASSCGRKENKDSRTPPEQSAEQTERTDVLTNVYRGTAYPMPEGYSVHGLVTNAWLDSETGEVTSVVRDGDGGIRLLTVGEKGVVGDEELGIPEDRELLWNP